LQGDAGRDIFWRDRVGNSADTVADFVAASDADNLVDRFANGADRTLDGDRIAGPTDPANNPLVDFASNPLFSTNGPKGTDVIQGPRFATGLFSFQPKDYTGVGAALAALTRDTDPVNSWLIRRAMVDFGDGTYGVRLENSFYRIDARLPATMSLAGVDRPYYAELGAQNSIWVALAEKALAMYIPLGTGVFSYAALKDSHAGGVTEVTDVFRAFGDVAPQIYIGVDAPIVGLTQALNTFSSGGSYLTVSLADSSDSGFRQGAWQEGTLGRKFVTFAWGATPDYTTPMVYTVWAVETSNNQVTAVILRNPWGSDTGGKPVSYSDANPNDGLIRLTIAELSSSYRGGELAMLWR